jgi:hypothetical protein
VALMAGLSPRLNPSQFKGNDTWMSNMPSDELIDEYHDQYSRHVEFEAKHNADRQPWPRHTGPGSSYMAHQGLIARDYSANASMAFNEMQRRGLPPRPGFDPKRSEDDVATIQLGLVRAKRKQAEGVANGTVPLSKVSVRYGESERNTRARYGAHAEWHWPEHEADAERISMAHFKPVRRG